MSGAITIHAVRRDPSGNKSVQRIHKMAFFVLQVVVLSCVFSIGQSFSNNVSSRKTSTVSMSSVVMPNKPMSNLWNRVMFTIGLNKRVRTDEELKKGIANFYDESSQVWLDVWVSYSRKHIVTFILSCPTEFLSMRLYCRSVR